MKKKINQKEKGFTLIELLAVIVVLAILALIAVPIVLNIIKDARNNSNKRSIESYVRSIEYAISEHLSENPDQEVVTWDDIKDKVEYKGKVECQWGENLSSISTTGEITLHGCKVNNKTNSIYGYVKGKVVEENETAVQTLLKKANAESVTTYTNGDTHEMYTFSHEATEQTEALTDYRYIGNDPYNYVTFNNELWRIIGIFTVEDENRNKEQRIKIIRNESLGNMTWNSSGLSEWKAATLQTYINGDYYNSLSEDAKSMIGNTKYYLGGTSYNSTINYSKATDIYTWERGTTVYTGRSTNWIGKIGLMYPSDYAYTYALGVDDKCYTDTYKCGTSIPTKGWLYNSATQWLISPDSGYSGNAFYVYPDGFVLLNYVANAVGVRPSIYLISEIRIEKGTGTQEDPYVLK